MTTVLTASNVSKRFTLQHTRPHTVKDAVVGTFGRKQAAAQIHWALQDVSFSVQQGAALGIIGHNGAGKSTLLRLLCGLGRPTSGKITSFGHVSGLLDLGSGFHNDMTGRENIMTGGLLSGMTRAEVRLIEHEIIAFAELEAFIDEPIRTYSSGMYLRLAFATAMHFDPNVLILDEVLAVGDERFQKKCLDRLASFRASGKTLILTSHVMEQIRSLCDEVLVLEQGQVVMQGEPEQAITCYHDLMRKRSERRASQIATSTASLVIEQGNRQGTHEVTIDQVRTLDGQNRPTTSIASGDSLTVELAYTQHRQVPDLILTLGIFNEHNIKCFETTIESVVASFGDLGSQGQLVCEFPALPVLPGRYYVNVGLYPTDWSYVYDYHWQMHNIHVTDLSDAPRNESGVLALRPRWSTPPAPVAKG